MFTSLLYTLEEFNHIFSYVAPDILSVDYFCVGKFLVMKLLQKKLRKKTLKVHITSEKYVKNYKCSATIQKKSSLHVQL